MTIRVFVNIYPITHTNISTITMLQRLACQGKGALQRGLVLGFLLSGSMLQAHAQSEYQRETPVVKAVRKVAPAVVNISSTYESRKRLNPFSGFGLDPFFDSFFKDFFDPELERRQTKTSLGSGVIIDGKRGLILTNAHVIAKAGTISAVLQDEREFEAQIVGADPEFDLAVLKIESQDVLPSVEMASSDDLMIGETVIAIGNPFGFSHTVTTGVISAVNRSVRTDDRVFHEFIQIDASISPGNSGGPLLNINGNLIGINTAIYAKAQGIGFAIPISKAKKIINDLILYGEVVQAWVGITVQDIDARLSGYLNPPGQKGVLIRMVEPGSPAQNAGLKDGDIIIEIANKSVQSAAEYRSIARTLGAGDRISAAVWRNGKKFTVIIKTKVYPLELVDDLTRRLLGITVADLTQRNRSFYRIRTTEGIVITELDEQSYLAKIGAKPGDIIRQVDEMSIKTKEDFRKAMIKYRLRESLVVLLQRGDQGYYITIRL